MVGHLKIGHKNVQFSDPYCNVIIHHRKENCYICVVDTFLVYDCFQ